MASSSLTPRELAELAELGAWGLSTFGPSFATRERGVCVARVFQPASRAAAKIFDRAELQSRG